MRRVVVAVVIALVGCKSKTEQAAYDAKAKALREKIAAEDKAKADAQAATRKACKLGPDAGTLLDDEVLGRECKERVRSQALVPGSVDFPYGYRPVFSEDGCRRIYADTFTAKNGFGVEVQHAVRCTLDPRTGDIAVKLIR